MKFEIEKMKDKGLVIRPVDGSIRVDSRIRPVEERALDRAIK